MTARKRTSGATGTEVAAPPVEPAIRRYCVLASGATGSRTAPSAVGCTWASVFQNPPGGRVWTATPVSARATAESWSFAP